jgi:hypothetical protein
MPLPPKATPLIRTDFRCTVIVKYYCIVPLKRGYPFKKKYIYTCNMHLISAGENFGRTEKRKDVRF